LSVNILPQITFGRARDILGIGDVLWVAPVRHRSRFDTNAHLVAPPDNLTRSVLHEWAEANSHGVEGRVGVIGTGSVVEAGKYLGGRLNLPVIVVPSALTTDAPFTDSVAVREAGKVVYERFSPPELVLIDWSLLREAPTQLHALGVADVVSIWSATWDWRRAHEDGKLESTSKLDEAAVNEALAIVERLVSAGSEIAAGTIDGLRELLACITAEVGLCRRLGTSRPEEGSEHFIAYALEALHVCGRRHLHGQLVLFGLALSLGLQGQDAGSLRHLGSDLKWSMCAGCRDQFGGIELETLTSYVKEQSLPWSVLNLDPSPGAWINPFESGVFR
jgi:glycerol dehydrogenase-like iron-containing ADH family enzyme